MKPNGLKLYFVVGPERVDYSLMYADPPEPPEHGCDCVMVEAENKRDAVMLGVQEILRTQRRSTAEDNRGDGLPPWAGYRAEEVPPCEICGGFDSCECAQQEPA